MKVIFGISTIELAKNTYSLADLFPVLHIVRFYNFFEIFGPKICQKYDFFQKNLINLNFFSL